VRKRFYEPLVNDQQPMGIPKEGGNTPQNHGLSGFEVLRERKGLGPRVQKPEEPTENPTSPYQKLAEHLRRNPRSATIGGRGWGHERFRRIKDIEKG
jgi:hypothetical protein